MDSQLEGLGVAFFTTGPGLGLIMYILTSGDYWGDLDYCDSIAIVGSTIAIPLW